jgi:site-specific DNA-methyltransferase (adenine-specific)
MIKSYYESDNVTLYCADCLDVMREMDAGSVDVCVTDPPYGIKITRSSKAIGTATHTSRKATNDSWDDKIPTKEYFDEMFKVSKNQIVFGANYFWENFYSSQCYIIWDKREFLPTVPFADTEFAWTSYTDKPSKRYILRNHGFIRDSKDEKTGHPTQKPTELMVRILNDFTSEGDTVLDCFTGSGSTGVACVQTGRKFIGIEISEEYCQIARKRIQDAESQLRLPIEI